MQTTLLGLAIAFILALIAALVGPYFIDWNQFRPQFEAEATRIIGAPVRVGGKLDARLLPAPSLQLHSVVVGGANDLGKVRADKLDVEFSLGSLMRGEWRATELTVNGMSLDLGLDPKGRIDWPASTGTFNLGSLAIDRLNLTGRIALHDAASRSTLELNDIVFSGDVRSLAGSVRGDGNFTANGVYRQANVVHVLDDASIAASYLQTFEQIWAQPDDIGVTRDWITEHNPMSPQQPVFAGFSPRTGGADLQAFVQIISAAKKDVLFVTAFSLPDAILNALLGQPHDDVLRYGLQNTASRITGFHADRSAEFAATALLNTGLEGWLRENMKGQKGNLLVHTKAVVTDFTTDTPTIISGSHNLSVSASNGNDENYLIIRGDTDLADRYGLELLRFYEHYRFRYFAKKLALKQVSPLAVDDHWTNDYYIEGDLRQLSRLRFAGR